MPTPEFVLSLREKIGHDLLWLMGVSGYVEDEQGRVLLGRRSDTGEWAMVYGINEPGDLVALRRERNTLCSSKCHESSLKTTA